MIKLKSEVYIYIMSVVLPKEVAYDNMLPALPNETTNTSVVLAPVNGSSFDQNALIQFDCPARGFMQPDSLYLRYKVSFTHGAAVSEIRGTPATSFFVKNETIFGSQIVESIQNWGQLQSMLFDCQLSGSQKAGLAPALGYRNNATLASVTTTNEVMNGRQAGTVSTAETFYVSVPFNNILSSSDKLVPLCMMPNVRIQLTTDAISNIMTSSGTIPSSYTLSNLELCFDMIDLGSNVEDIIRNMGEKIYIKSQSFNSIGNTLASGVSGTSEIVFNTRLSSIKSLFTIFGGNSSANSVNKQYDSYDPTSSSGDLQYIVAGTPFPTRPISTSNNKAAFLIELKQALGGIHSLSTNNFGFTLSQYLASGTDTTTTKAPARFIFGVNTERLPQSNALLTGISTQNSAISLRINNSTATTQSYSVQLIAMYDALIEIDTVMRSATVKQ